VLFYGDHSAMWVREEEAAPVDAAAELEPEAARALRAWGRARRKCAARASSGGVVRVLRDALRVSLLLVRVLG